MKAYQILDTIFLGNCYDVTPGTIHEIKEKPIAKKRGFHFLQTIGDCLIVPHAKTPSTKIFLIEVLGKISLSADSNFCCTNKLMIVKELSWTEVLELHKKQSLETEEEIKEMIKITEEE